MKTQIARSGKWWWHLAAAMLALLFCCFSASSVGSHSGAGGRH